MASTSTPEEPQETHAENLAVLAEYRAKHVRASEEVVQRGERVLSIRGALKRMGEEGARHNPYHIGKMKVWKC